MENTTKKTKATYFEELRELVMNSVSDQEMQNEYLAFIDKELATLDKRREVAKARAEKRKAESDALTDRIFDVLHYDYITVDDIMSQLQDVEDITKNKVTSRLGKLIRMGKVEKESIKTEEGPRMAYRKIDAVAA